MTVEEIKTAYPYLYETHLHTSEASACARASAAEMARSCKAYGYTGIFVTDHNWGGNTCVNRAFPWKTWVKQFCGGYRNAKAEGDRIGLDVFFAYEAGYQGTEFLIYGVDEDWLLYTPQIKTASVKEQYALVKEHGGMVVHAHPYREEYYIPEIRIYPEFVDGVEGINATHSNTGSTAHNDPAYDDRAVAYAKEYGLPLTAGSDVHSTALLGGGVAFREKLDSGKDYVNRISGGGDYVLTNGQVWYDKYGNVLAES